MSQENNHIGKALFSTTNSNLMYPIVQLDWDDGVFRVEDLDTGKLINWYPGTDQESCEKIFGILGFEIGDYDGD